MYKATRNNVVVPDTLASEEGHPYFTDRPTYGVRYLHYPLAHASELRESRQLKSSYFVDEDGAVIRVTD